MKRYLLLAAFGTLVCWTAWVLVLFNIDPFLSGFIGLASFYFSLFLALLGSFSLLGFLFRRTFSRDTIAYHHIGVSIRQALFLSLVLVGTLLLRGTKLYTWWNVAFLLAGFTILEWFFLTREST
ncbi:MAG: hypothetical protein V1778_04090 [bacterium]